MATKKVYTTRSDKRERGRALTISLVVHTIIAVMSASSLLYSIGLYGINLILLSIPAVMLDLIVSFLIIGSVIGIWRWKKWGGYLLVALFFTWLFGFYVHEVRHWQIVTMIVHLAIFLFISAFYYNTIKRKWRFFS